MSSPSFARSWTSAARSRTWGSRWSAREPEWGGIGRRGAGRAFCAGYDLQMAPAAEAQAQERSGGWDPVADFRMMSRNVRAFMSLWESRKPVVAPGRGWGGGGGGGA